MLILEGSVSGARKQPFVGALMNRYSENTQQIYRRTPMPKCDFKNITNQLIEITLRMDVLL